MDLKGPYCPPPRSSWPVRGCTREDTQALLNLRISASPSPIWGLLGGASGKGEGHEDSSAEQEGVEHHLFEAPKQQGAMWG